MRFWKYRDQDGEVVDSDGVARPVVVAPAAATPVVTGPSLEEIKSAEDAAYAKGRRDERASRRSHPIIALLVVLLAIVGAAFIYFSIKTGSLSGGGRAAETAAAQAKAEAPGALHAAGAQISQTASSVSARVHDATASSGSDASPAASQ